MSYKNLGRLLRGDVTYAAMLHSGRPPLRTFDVAKICSGEGKYEDGRVRRLSWHAIDALRLSAHISGRRCKCGAV
jgi:hypothetical protein